jgi:hypothetical protein
MNVGDAITLFKRMHEPIENTDKSLPIDIKEFIDSYLQICSFIGIKPMKKYYPTNNISFQNIIENIYPFRQILKSYERSIFDIKKKNKYFNLTNCQSVIIATSIIDICIIIIVLGSKHDVPVALLIARGSAVLILMQIIYIFVPLSELTTGLPDKVIYQLIPSCNQKTYHIVFGIKLFIATIIHTFGHVMQIEIVLKKCKTGCKFSEITIVKKHDELVTISRSYFYGSYPYFTGLILLFMIIMMIVGILFKSHFRYIKNTLYHKYLGIGLITGIILHGVQQLIGLNISYILTLPVLIAYSLKNYRMLLPINRLIINAHRWNISKTSIHLYLKESPSLIKYFNKTSNSNGLRFNMISLYLKCPRINNEWHPFTLIRYSDHSSLMIKISGEWTTQLKNILTHSMITRLPFIVGVCNKSKFRFVLFYETQIHICAGVGITACMSALSYLKINRKLNIEVIIYWSISDVSIVQELAYELLQIITNMPNVKLNIYYSNSKLFNPSAISDHERLRFLYLQSIVHNVYNIDIISGVSLPNMIKIGRIDIGQELYKIINKYDFPKKIGIFICSSAQYAKYLETDIGSMQTNNTTFDIWSECV